MCKCVLLLVAAVSLVGVPPILAQNADTVDGFDAYSTPHANALLALNGSARMSGAVIANNSIPGSRLVPGAVTAGRLGNNSVTTDKISDGQVMSDDLAAGAVTRTKIANGAVTTTRIADQAVTGGKLAYGAVTAGRLANNSVSTSKIIDGAVRGEDVHVPLLVGGSRDGYLIGCFNGSSGSSSSGITGYSTAASGSTRGVVGACNSPSGKGVHGLAKSTSGENFGVYGETASADGGAVYGRNTAIGNYGYIAGPAYGAYAVAASSNGTGIFGNCSNGSSAYGVWGRSNSGVAGYFSGKVQVTGRFDSPDKHFKIDHPLDPENMYLDHACVESSERKNVYDGTVVLDARGEAWVELPDWFEALNCDFRYQLTPIGAPGPNLYIARRIQDGCFAIAGGTPGMEVCWMVTGVRHDPYALAHPMQVEVEKPERERGSYLHPELYGMPETMSIEWATKPEAMMEVRRER
jgi:hypothetical protein